MQITHFDTHFVLTCLLSPILTDEVPDFMRVFAETFAYDQPILHLSPYGLCSVSHPPVANKQLTVLSA